jgi:zeta-carotene desaturase
MLPGGQAGEIGAGGWPAPFHASSSFLKFDLLTLGDKVAIGRAMLAMMSGLPKDRGKSFLEWLQSKGQTKRAIDRFWGPVLVSALNEELDSVSVHYGSMVFRDAFLKSAEAGRMGVPTVPLSDLYGVAANYITERGGEVHLRASVESFTSLPEGVSVNPGGEELLFDYLIPAVPYQGLEKILPDSPESEPIRHELTEFRSSPITGIHLWFDREITPLDHAVLLERNIQWMFQKSKILEGRVASSHAPLGAGSYLELVVSSSKSMVNMGRNEIIDLALAELAEFFPKAKDARVLKATVVKEIHATFSPTPGLEKHRPSPLTPWPRVFLTGDWTATGWPATMEGAVRGGYITAQTLANVRGDEQTFLVPDLAPRGLMRLFR